MIMCKEKERRVLWEKDALGHFKVERGMARVTGRGGERRMGR